jgi:hypothetical protein
MLGGGVDGTNPAKLPFTITTCRSTITSATQLSVHFRETTGNKDRQIDLSHNVAYNRGLAPSPVAVDVIIRPCNFPAISRALLAEPRIQDHHGPDQ